MLGLGVRVLGYVDASVLYCCKYCCEVAGAFWVFLVLM